MGYQILYACFALADYDSNTTEAPFVEARTKNESAPVALFASAEWKVRLG
jgi:hypothetical protein